MNDRQYQSLRSDSVTAHNPVIALSANAMPLNTESSLEAGFFRYPTESIKLNESMGALDAALQFSQTASGRAAKNNRNRPDGY